MSRNKLIQRIKSLRKQGVSYRAIEARFPSALGAGNGTKAFRLAKSSAK
jgi:hypothetical protein